MSLARSTARRYAEAAFEIAERDDSVEAWMAALIVASLIVSFVLLAPSIVLGYAVKAAERDDMERGF